jgi:UDP-N-acetylglucosamine 2-epimerase
MKLLDELLQITLTNLSEGYNESTDFEEDVSNIEASLKKVKTILESKNWKEWMQDSKSNYGTDSVNRSKRVLDNLKKTIKEFDDLYEELVDAS